MKSPEASIIHAPIFISVHRHAIIIIYIRVPTPIATAAAIFPLQSFDPGINYEALYPVRTVKMTPHINMLTIEMQMRGFVIHLNRKKQIIVNTNEKADTIKIRGHVNVTSTIYFEKDEPNNEFN